MLLKKKLLMFTMLFLFLFSLISYAQVCEVGNIKQVLRKILHLYFTEPESVSLTKDEVKDLLVFYLSISAQNLTVDCSALGVKSNKPIFDVMNLGENLPDKIPSCADGTKYGECSKFRPAYCYAGALYSKCDVCGCPANSVCGKSGKCETLAQNITCFKDIDCGQNTFVGDYYCTSNYIAKDYLNYTCINPGTTSSSCVSSTGTVLLTYCNPSLSQTCVAGQNFCQVPITNVSTATNLTNQTNQTQPTGICLVRDTYTSVPVFSAPDIDKGYAKMAKAGINTISGLQSACTRADFDSLIQTYCTQNSNPVQEQVMTYDSQGNWQSLSCGAFGCNFKNCTSSINQTQNSCVDSDNGIYPYAQGFASGYQAGTFINTYDTCSGSYIYERYCNGTSISTTSIYCDYGCSNGACANQTTTSCSKPLKAVSTSITKGGYSSTLNSYFKIWAYSNSSLPENRYGYVDYSGWYDSGYDGGVWSIGKMYQSAKILVLKVRSEAPDFSTPINFPAGTLPLTIDDSLFNINMPAISSVCAKCNEWFVVFADGSVEKWPGAISLDSWINNMLTSCPANNVTNACIDSDNGYDYYKYGEVKDLSGSMYRDACIPDLSGLTEFACKTDGYYTSTFHSCVNENGICSSGACVPAAGNSWCTDPDGFNVNQYSVVSYSVEGTSYSSADVCVNDDGLVESKCNNKQQTTEYYSCKSVGKVCQNGACLNQTNQTTLKGYAEQCTNGIECKYGLACISDPLDNNVGKCGWWGYTYTNFSQCSAGYYPSTPCMCGNIAIGAGACNHGIFYWPPTQSGRSIGSSCTDSSQCSTGICIFGLCSYAVRCSPSTPGYCHDHEECVAFGASC